MRPKTKKTHNVPTFDSLGSCASVTGIQLSVLKRAKRAGCPAFVNSRVELGPLLAWLFKRGHDVTEDWSGRLLAAQARLEELKLEELEKSLVPMATARKVINDVLGPLKIEMMSASATLSSRCNPGDPELARIAIADWARQTLQNASDAITREAPESEP